MLRLNLLGAISLVDNGDLRNLDIGGTKNLALLIFLVIEGQKKPVRRDTAAGIFWPESEQKKARQSLNQSLHVLRTAIGEVVSSRGQEELSVNLSSISCDCHEFVQLAKVNKLQEALELYGGEFADGLHVKESAEFDDWLMRQRTDWRNRFAAVVMKLYHASLNNDDLPSAITWAEKLIGVAPHNEEPIKNLIMILVERGKGAAAIRVYGEYERKLRNSFDLAPSPEIKALIAKLPTATQESEASRSPLDFYVGNALTSRQLPSKLGAVALVGIVFTAVVLGITVTNILPPKAKGSSISDEPHLKVAVTRFASGSAQREASVLNDALQWRLRSVGFDVIDAGNRDASAVSAVIDDGQRGITFMVGGEVDAQSDKTVIARLWLNDATNGTRIWESRFKQKEADAHLIATQLAEAVTTQIRRAAGRAVEMGPEIRKVSQASWRAAYQVRERMEAAADMRHQGSALGSLTELSAAETVLVELTKHEPAWTLPWLLRARIADARATTALIADDLDRGGAELERGIRILDSVTVHMKSEDLYEIRGLLQYRRWIFGIDDVEGAGRLLQRAESDLREALRLGHERSGSYAALSGVMFAEGRYAESFVYAHRAYDSNIFLRTNEEILNRLFNSAFHAGDDTAAAYWCRALQNAQPNTWPAVMCHIHVAGFTGLEEVKSLQREISNFVAAPPIRKVMEPRVRAAYAISLAQVGMIDSARATLANVRSKESDPEVVLFSAFALAALKDAPRAHAMLRQYLSEYHGTRSTVLHMRWLN